MRSKGLSFIELLVTTTIVAITSSYAIPTGLRWIQSTRLQSEVTVFANHLQSAKMEAIRRNGPVIFCPSANATHCDNTIQWQHGWMLFSDRNRNGLFDANEAIILASKSSGRILIQTSRGRKKLTFRSSGLTLGSNTTFAFCDPTQTIPPKFIILSNHGKLRTSNQHPSIRRYTC